MPTSAEPGLHLLVLNVLFKKEEKEKERNYLENRRETAQSRKRTATL